ncbi:hypothetical protein L1049_007101 [Liquidambar formosana]|uniref:Uncharacterized protein n=1 Tax=Liquidambar formosana TaxID=63359 RepID=A0AAP0WUK6_LIQFO
MSSSSSPPPLNFFGLVLSESKRIYLAHSRHFLALALLFLLPVSFIITIYATLGHLRTHSQFLIRHTHAHTHPFPTQALLVPLIYFISIPFLSLCALGSITFSVFQGFHGRPVKLIPALNSLLHSFLPLFVTVLASQIIQLVVCFAFGILVFLVIKGTELLGYKIECSSPYFIAISIVALVCLALVLVYLEVNWVLAGAVVVAESSWGFQPLKRSSSLVKKKGAARSLLLFYGLLTGMLVWVSSLATEAIRGATNGWKNGAFVAQTVVTTFLVMLLILQSFVAKSVLYIYCEPIVVDGEAFASRECQLAIR